MNTDPQSFYEHASQPAPVATTAAQQIQEAKAAAKTIGVKATASAQFMLPAGSSSAASSSRAPPLALPLADPPGLDAPAQATADSSDSEVWGPAWPPNGSPAATLAHDGSTLDRPLRTRRHKRRRCPAASSAGLARPDAQQLAELVVDNRAEESEGESTRVARPDGSLPRHQVEVRPEKAGDFRRHAPE